MILIQTCHRSPRSVVTYPIRIFFLLGVKTLFVTSAAGGLNPKFSVSDIMVIQDHINLRGFASQQPLHGPNDHPRQLRSCAVPSYSSRGSTYMVAGPSFKMVANSRLLQLQTDNVRMSTLPELLITWHCGTCVLGLSLIINMVVADNAEDTARVGCCVSTAGGPTEDHQQTVGQAVGCSF
uniref:purine-nucleoside phosphorylase n=1 Tax=Scleropages formosus TaxID=113540 RepID=A0A8C9RK87_SCLFO